MIGVITALLADVIHPANYRSHAPAPDEIGAKTFVLGLLADLPGKNCWTIAEQLATPVSMGCSTCSPGGPARGLRRLPRMRTELEARGIGLCWRSPATNRSGQAAPPSVPLLCSSLSQRGPGNASRPGSGAKGHRHYDWAFFRLDDDQRWLLVRR